jgi:hypothetical protein
MFGIGAVVLTHRRWALPFRSAPMRPTQHPKGASVRAGLSTVEPYVPSLNPCVHAFGLVPVRSHTLPERVGHTCPAAVFWVVS